MIIEIENLYMFNFYLLLTNYLSFFIITASSYKRQNEIDYITIVIKFNRDLTFHQLSFKTDLLKKRFGMI